MARRNKKRHVEGVSISRPLVGVVIAAVLVGLAYVWFTGRCEKLGHEISVLEKQKAALDKQLSHEEFKWSRMKSPMEVEKMLARFRLEMAQPRAEQVVRLRESDLPPLQPATLRPVQVARIERVALHE